MESDFMKRFVLAIAVIVPLVCTAEQAAPKKKTAAAGAKAATSKKAATPAAPKALTIPADAKQIDQYIYAKTDEHGKKWLYYQTPFGVTRAEEPTAAQKDAAASVSAGPDYTVEDAGDKLRFSKVTPFGTKTWTRSKSELTPDERESWERQKQQAAPKREQ
ncbi:MAG: hypothetical protein ABI822_31230 [Bryobacteraceae bacterium]